MKKRIIILLSLSIAPQLLQAEICRENLELLEQQRRTRIQQRQENIAARVAVQETRALLNQYTAEAIIALLQNPEELQEFSANQINSILQAAGGNILNHNTFRTHPLFTNNDGTLHYTPLMYALANHNVYATRVFLAYSDPAQATDNYASLLDFIAQMDLEDSDDQDVRFIQNITSLLESIYGESDELIPLFERYNNDGNTPLIEVLNRQDDGITQEIAITFLSLGASPDTPSQDGTIIPIFNVIEREDISLLGAFMARDVDLGVTNQNGVTARSLITQEMMAQLEQLSSSDNSENDEAEDNE